MDVDVPITKRLHISGLTPALTSTDLSKRLSTFGTVKAVDGFGLQDGLGMPRKFGYITLETTVGKLARCLNLLSGSTWKGAKLRIGEAKPDFAERLSKERQATLDEPPKKRRKRSAGVAAEDMSLVTPDNVKGRGGWKVTPLGRIIRPVRIRPEKPLPPVTEEKKKKPDAKGPLKKLGEAGGEKKKKKREKDPDSRARRRTIDPTRWGSVHLKGMFLDMEVAGTGRGVGDLGQAYEDLEASSDGSESEGNEEEVENPKNNSLPAAPPQSPARAAHVKPVAPASIPIPAPAPLSQVTRTPTLPDNNTDVALEKNNSLNILASLFGGKDASDWVGRESVDSDIDEDELTKGNMMIDGAEGDFEVVPMDGGSDAEDAEEEEEVAMEVDATVPAPIPAEPPTQKMQQATILKDLFAPREDAGFSLLGHLNLDLELDDEVPFLTTTSQYQDPSTSTQPSLHPQPHLDRQSHLQPHPTRPTQLNPRQALFFPLPPSAGLSHHARPKDVFDIVKDNGWNWRDPAVGFYRTGTEEDIKKKWEAEKVELTKEWKRRCREAGKVSRRRRGGGAEEE